MSRVERIIRVIFVLFMAFILGVIIYGHGGQSSDVSNWVIAGANVVMAFAAVMAFKAAPKFLNEFFAREGYRHATEMINETIIHLGVNNTFLLDCSHLVQVYRDLLDRPYTKINNTRFTDAFRKLNDEIEKNREYLKKIKEASFKMETYGIYASESKKKYWIDMTTNLSDMTDGAVLITNKLENEVNRYTERTSMGLGNSHMFRNHLPIDVKKALENVIEEWNKMIANRSQFLSGDKHVKTLFVVKGA